MYTQQEINSEKGKIMDRIINLHEAMQKAIEIESASSMDEAAEMLKFWTGEFKEWDSKVSEETASWAEHDAADLNSNR